MYTGKKNIVYVIISLLIIGIVAYLTYKDQSDSVQPIDNTDTNISQNSEQYFCPSINDYPDTVLEAFFLKNDSQSSINCTITPSSMLVLNTKYNPVDSGLNYQEYNLTFKAEQKVLNLGTYPIGIDKESRLKIEVMNDSKIRIYNENPVATSEYRKQWYINPQTLKFVSFYIPEITSQSNIPALEVKTDSINYRIALISKWEGDHNTGEKYQATGISVNGKLWQTFQKPFNLATSPLTFSLEKDIPKFENVAVSEDLKTISFSLTQVGTYSFQLE